MNFIIILKKHDNIASMEKEKPETAGVNTKRFRIYAAAAIFYMFPCTEICGFVPALLLALGTMAFAAVSWKNVRMNKTAGFVSVLFLFAGTAVLFAWLSQYVLTLDLFALGRRKIALTAAIVFSVCILFWIITNHSSRSAQLAAAAVTVMAISNYYVYTFRGSEMAPNDFMSVNTALTVAYDYEYTLTQEIVIAAGILMMFLAFTSALPVFRFKKKIWGRVMPLVTLACSVIFAYTQSAGLNAEYFGQDGSQINGYLVNFMLQVKGIFVEVPRNYSRIKVAQIADSLGTNHGPVNTEEYPDVIVIMDESFADMDVLGDGLITSQPVIPYISSLEENTTKGYALSSVYGGGTPNSEYEVLTGNTMMFLPKGVMAYQQYIKQPTYSMVKEFKDLGYRTIAMHPFNSKGWMRTRVYPYLGFDEMHFEEDFPQEDLIRFFVSDREMFETVLDTYRKTAETEEHVFLFGVTMQNHGGYEFKAEENPDLEQRYHKSIRVQGNVNGIYDDAEQYLSLIHETDKAVEYLLNELKQSDRKVVVLFYGDHFPGLGEDFYDMVHGKDFETLDEHQKKYTVPFFIWTNYDSEEKTVELTSLNYLSNYLYDAAGITYPAYNKFLKLAEERIPAINANGFWSAEQGKFIKYRDAKGEEKELLDTYYMLEYNSLIDHEHTNQKLFPSP